MNLVARRPRIDRFRRSVGLLVAAVGCALVLAQSGWARPAGTAGTAGALGQQPAMSGAGSVTAPAAGSPFTLMQMNLCLSGLAGCYGKAAYPAVVREAVAQIRAANPDAVTFNEVCRRDAARIARHTGYHLNFSRVLYLGAPLPCINPGGRGLFGVGVLSKAPVHAFDTRAFEAQGGIEQRRWLCVATRADVEVCTAHLSTRHTPAAAATNDEQCAELAGLLASRTAHRAVVFAGDVNRRRSCASHGMWTRTDRSADQVPGLQHVYGSGAALRSPVTNVLPTRHSDHDVMVVGARLVSR